MDDARRRSAAHVLVGDVASPTLDEWSSHHLLRVLRLRDGEAVTVTDGAGRWCPCRLAAGDLVVDGEVIAESAPREVTVAVAPPKGDRLDWLVQKCTEIGVGRIVLLSAERSVVRWDDDRAGKRLERLRRIAAEAAMQARRVWFPEVGGPVAAAAVLAAGVIAEPGGRAIGRADTTVAVGPEGGWSPGEVSMAADRVSLGANVLRVETAAVVAVTLMVAAS